MSTQRDNKRGFTRRTPPKAADLAAERAPVRSCRKPPVSAPALMEFQGSSCEGTGEEDTSGDGSCWLK